MGQIFSPPPPVAWMLSLALLAACASAATATKATAGGPYTVKACNSIELAANGGVDLCGQQRTITWDFNNDGVFDDAYGDTALFVANLRPGVYTISARASSPSPCPYHPLVLSATVRVTGPATVPVIKGLRAVSYTLNNEAYAGERFRVVADTETLSCRHFNVTFDCGPDNVATPKKNGFCQYNSLGEKRITATLEQDGFVASAELVVTVYTMSISGPYELGACAFTTASAGASVDACGNQRDFEWNFNGDGAFNDASSSYVFFDNSGVGLAPGVHTISVRASSPSCTASSPLVRTTTLNITAPPPTIYNVHAVTLGNVPGKATIGESITISTLRMVQTCLPFTETVDCGPDNLDDGTAGVCQYNSAGVKVITVTLEQFDFVVSKSISITLATLIIGGPYRADVCGVVQLKAAASVDACGVERSLAWDVDNNGVFDNAHGLKPTINPYNQGLGLGVHPISVRASSSSSSCPSSPPEVASTTVNVTAARLVIVGIDTFPASYLGVASVEERILVNVRSSRAFCAPDNLEMDCGADSVSEEEGYCRYSSPGQKTITATVTQFGVTASLSRHITVATFYMRGPFRIPPCSSAELAAPFTIDACGSQRVLAWDFNNDGAFDDATGSRPYLYNSVVHLAPGVHPIRVQSSSNPACPASPPEVHTVNVTITPGPKLAIRGINTFPASGQPVASTGEDIRVNVATTVMHCLPYTLTLDCGADNASSRTMYCRYNTSGQKVITATVTQNGISASSTLTIDIAP
eukprot:jgi/Chlat1/4257/Chrsp279S00810